MNAASELIPLEEISEENAPAIYGVNILDRYVETARANVASEVVDLTTRKGRERIASLAAQVARSKTAVEKPGREYLKRIKEKPKVIEAELREFVQQMDALRDEVRAPLNEWQAHEDARIDGHNKTLDWLAGLLAVGDDVTVEQLRQQLGEVEAFEISEALEEFEADAARGKDKAMTALRDQIARREKHEAELAAIAKFQAEQAEREQKERDALIAKEAAERATREAEAKAQAERDAAARREQDLIDQAAEQQRKAEQDKRDAAAAAEQARLNAELAEQRRVAAEKQAELDRIEAGQRAERERLDAIERQAKAVEQARLDEVERQQRAADEAERQAKAREKDKAHIKAVCLEAQKAMVELGIDEDCAKAVIILIHQRKIPAISIQY